MEEETKKAEQETDGEVSPLDIIENQLEVILYVSDIDTEIYDKCLEDKIRVITRALLLIHKIQGKLIKEL